MSIKPCLTALDTIFCRILSIIGKKIIGDNGTGDEAREAARQSLTEAYETKQQEHIEDMKNGSVLDDIDELNELWRI